MLGGSASLRRATCRELAVFGHSVVVSGALTRCIVISIYLCCLLRLWQCGVNFLGEVLVRLDDAAVARHSSGSDVGVCTKSSESVRRCWRCGVSSAKRMQDEVQWLRDESCFVNDVGVRDGNSSSEHAPSPMRLCGSSRRRTLFHMTSTADSDEDINGRIRVLEKSLKKHYTH